MTVHTDATPDVLKTPRNVSGPRPIAPVAHDEQRDLELVAAVARGDAEAQRTLATRMASRIERVARALMGGSLDARDAARHALIELLRNHANYRGKLRLERWADRVAAISVMRYAVAVSRRATDPDVALPAAESSNAARTFEQYLGMLSTPSRQQLLLRHALGFSIAELADVMQCSPQAARERLLNARRELRSLVRRRESQPPLTSSSAGIGLGAQRWCALRDREALGEPLLQEELAEVALLEAKETEVWAFVAQVRALELYFDTRTPPRAPIDGELVDHALEAVAVSSSTLKTRAIVDDSAHETRAEREPSNWVGVFAWSASAALAAASAIALYWQQPQPVPVAKDAMPAPAAPVLPPPEPPRPTVESLPSARTAARGARLRHGGRALPEGTVLGQGDTLEANDKPGCIEIEPAFEACLAPGSAVTLSALQSGARRLRLVRGRVVARGNDAEGNARVSVEAEGVVASMERGAFALERAGDLVRVRALRGPITLETAREARALGEGEGAQVQAGVVTAASAQPVMLQRDWDVLATGLHQAKPSKSRAAVPKLEGEGDAVLAEREGEE